MPPPILANTPDHPLGAAVCPRFPRSNPFMMLTVGTRRDFGNVGGSGKWLLSYILLERYKYTIFPPEQKDKECRRLSL